MASPAVRIAILANAAQAKAELASVESRGQKFSKALGAASKVAAVGVLAVGAAAVKAGQAAAEDEAAQSKLAQTLKTAAGASRGQIAATESWITAQGKALGIADDELRPALGRLATATGDVGKAQKLASLAMNVSAGSGKSLESVSTALAKAQATGNVAALGKFGVATKDATGKTKSLSQITSELAQKYKGAAAKAADTTAGKQHKLTVQLGELQEQIGAKLLPVMTALADKGLELVDWASKHTAILKPLLIVLGSLTGLVLAAAAAQKVYTAGMLVYSVAAKAVTIATNAWKAAQFLLNIAMMANPVGLVIAAIVALIAIIVLIVAKNDWLRGKLVDGWNAIKAAAGAVWNWIKNLISSVASAIAGTVSGAWSKITGATSAAWNAVKNGVSSAWNGVSGAVSSGVGKVLTFVRDLPGKIIGLYAGAGKWLLDAGKDIIKGLLDGIESMIGAVKKKLSDLTSLIPKVKGPPRRDKKLLKPAGKLIMDGFIKGIDSRIPTLKRKLGAVSSLVKKTAFVTASDTASAAAASSAADVSSSSDAAPAGNTVININVSGAVDGNATATQIVLLIKRLARDLGTTPAALLGTP